MKIPFIFAQLLLVLCFTACKKSEDGPVFTDSNSRWGLIDELRPAQEVFNFSSTEKVNIVTADNISINFPSVGIRRSDGSLYPGDFNIYVTSMLTMKQMILNHSQTVGPEGLFESAGQVSITAGPATSYYPSLSLYPQYGAPQVTFPKQGPSTMPLATFPVWYGPPVQSFGDTASMNWATAGSVILSLPDSTSIANQPGLTNSVVVTDSQSGNQAQQFVLAQFGTINLDYYYHQDLPKTQIYIKAPEGINYYNSVCYLAFPEINSVAELWNFNSATNQFGLGGYQIPIGLKAKVVLISKQGTKYYSAIKPFTVSENLVMPVTLRETKLEEFKSALLLL